jgi:hypothetical protein
MGRVRPYKIDPPKGGKEKKKEKIGNEGKRGKRDLLHKSRKNRIK